MTGKRAMILLIGSTLLLLLAACSGAGTATSPGSEVTPSQAASQGAPATDSRTVAPVASVGLPTPAGGVSTNWAAFKDKVIAYTAMAPQISDLLAKQASGDTSAAKEIASILKPASEEMATWLDANPPDDCYRASWEPLREAVDLVADGAGAYLADDVAAGSDKLMAGGSRMVEAGGTISDSGDRCRAVGG